MRLPVRIKLLFTAAVNHVYYCNTVIAGDQPDPRKGVSLWLTLCIWRRRLLKVSCASWQKLRSETRSQTRLGVGGSSTAGTTCGSTTPAHIHAGGTEAKALTGRKHFPFLSLGMKTPRLVAGTQISRRHHFQPAVLAFQIDLLKILLLRLLPLKDFNVCLLPYLFAC